MRTANKNTQKHKYKHAYMQGQTHIQYTNTKKRICNHTQPHKDITAYKIASTQ